MTKINFQEFKKTDQKQHQTNLLIDDVLPPILPFGTREINRGLVPNRKFLTVFYGTSKNLLIQCSLAQFDQKDWLHISYSRGDRPPNSEDTKFILNNFVIDKTAIAVHPPKSVSDNSNCLHLWIPLGHNPLPDFRKGVGTI